MADNSILPGGERKLLEPWRGPHSPGLGPVSQGRFGEIIDASQGTLADESRPRPNPRRTSRRDQFSRATWLMIVIAGLVLGVAMTMLVAG